MLKNKKDIGDVLSSEHAKQKAVNRSYLLKMLQNLIRYLAHQGLPCEETGCLLKEELVVRKILIFIS